MNDNIFHFMEFDGKKKLKCESTLGLPVGCGWEGEKSKTIRKYFNSSQDAWMSLAGREGYIYLCPKCGRRLDEDWFRMS